MMRAYTILVLVAVLSAVGCDEELRAKKKAAKASASAAAAPKPPAPPQPPPEPVVKVVPRNNTVSIRISGIRSDKPNTSAEKALHDSVEVARYKIMEELRKLDPPVMSKPSLAKVRNEFLKKDSVREITPTTEQKEKFRKDGVDPNRLWVEIDVELTEAQVQSLRAADRVTDGICGMGLVLVVVFAGWGFLRVDAWSKGYLTTWLALAAAAGAIAAGLFIVRSSVAF